jgi:hypothetical protein
VGRLRRPHRGLYEPPQPLFGLVEADVDVLLVDALLDLGV